MALTSEEMALKRPDLDTIQQAHERIKPHIHRTPVLKSAAVDDICGAEVFFKCENLQKAGAFKARAFLAFGVETIARRRTAAWSA